jgi:RNA polymerase sigma-70 factor (ECF subfamily)
MPDSSDHEPFLTLLESHRGLLQKVARAYGRSPEDRADLVQEIVAELLRAFPRYQPVKPFSTWMYRVALNVAISSLRRQAVRARHDAGPSGPVLEELPAPVVDPAREADLRRLDGLVQALPPLDRALVVLYLDGQSHAATAEILGLSESNVGTKLGRIKERLRRALQDAGAE